MLKTGLAVQDYLLSYVYDTCVYNNPNNIQITCTHIKEKAIWQATINTVYKLVQHFLLKICRMGTLTEAHLEYVHKPIYAWKILILTKLWYLRSYIASYCVLVIWSVNHDILVLEITSSHKFKLNICIKTTIPFLHSIPELQSTIPFHWFQTPVR